MDQKKWLLIVGLIYFFSFGLEFLTTLIGRPTNLVEMFLGAEATGFLMFLLLWVVIWASGAFKYLKGKVPL